MNHSRSDSGCGGMPVRRRASCAARAVAFPGQVCQAAVERVVVFRLRLASAATRGSGERCSSWLTSTCGSSASAASSTASTRCLPVVLHRLLDAVGLRRRVLDDVRPPAISIEAREEVVVLREVRMAEHVRGDERVLGERVRVDQIAVARDCRGTSLRRSASAPSTGGSAGGCSARRTTSAACGSAGRRSRPPS